MLRRLRDVIRGRGLAWGVGGAGLLAALATGCMVGPDPRTPDARVPDDWTSPLAPTASPTTIPSTQQSVASTRPLDVASWWGLFNDRELNSLIDRALKANLDVRVATAQIRQARAARGTVASGLFPNLAATGTYKRSFSGGSSVSVGTVTGSGGTIATGGAGTGGGTGTGGTGTGGTGTGGTGTGGTGTGGTGTGGTGTGGTGTGGTGTGGTGTGGTGSTTTVVRSNGHPRDLFSAGFDASWEVDVFGGQRRSIEAADANIQASIWNRRAVVVTLLGEVATDYINLRSAQGQLAIARQNLASQQHTLDLTRRRQGGGFQTGLDVANAEATVAETLASIPPLEQSAQQSIYALSVLLAMPPGALSNELTSDSPIPTVPPEVPIGVPSDLLRRRPDVRQAEFVLHQQTARVGVAVADLYPSFSLTGTGGTTGTRFGLLGNWSDRFWSFGPTVNWPILDFGAIRSNIEVASSQEEQALTNYERSILTALQDVENALIAYTKEQQHRQALAEGVVANRRAVDLSKLLYQNGQTNFLNVLIAERSLFGAETSLVQSNATLATDLVALYKALGGGWEQNDAPPPRTTPGVQPTLNVPDLLKLPGPGNGE